MTHWRKGTNSYGNKCIYLFKRDKCSRGICYVYDKESLDGHLRTKCIDAFEYIEGLQKLKELESDNTTKEEEKQSRIVSRKVAKQTMWTV